MRKKLGFIALLATLPLHAGTMGEVTQPVNPWFASIGTGFSWTNMPGIVNPNPALWDASNQGYDSTLGDRGFYTFALGKQVHRYIDLSLSYIDHEQFNYQMYQNGSSSTPGFTGNSRNRYFNLQNRALLINGFLHPESSYYNAFNIDFTPFVGGGIGYARNVVNNFYTVGTISVSGTPVGSTSSIGAPTSRNSFAWQGSVGVNVKPQDSHFSVDAGYRYFDGGRFSGPANIYSDANGWHLGAAWAGKLTANQLFVEFKYTV